MGINWPGYANTGDWQLVERFNAQLNQAKKGTVSAMYAVGKLYEHGRGVDRNLVNAVKWYQKAASAGQASAKSRLGILYFEGRGVKQNYSKALKLLQEAANKSVPSAQYQLANMYELGTGVTQDINKAIHWYQQANKYGYYLAKIKAQRLQQLLSNRGSINREEKTVKTTPAAAKISPLISTLMRGKWYKRSHPTGYLPSQITNCVNSSSSSLKCISASQERSTGVELITYRTESTIIIQKNKKFTITYNNNVLDVAVLATEDGDGEKIDYSPSRVHKGKQGKQRQLNCLLKGKDMISCRLPGRQPFELRSR